MAEFVKQSREEIEKLKKGWKADPCWDIEDTEGFEAHREELLQFAAECEAEWEEAAKERDQQIIKDAEALGLVGLYKLIKDQEKLLKRHERALEVLADAESYDDAGWLASRILQGYED